MDMLTIGIAGGTGSGKTTLTDNIVTAFGKDVSVIHHDSYYKAHNSCVIIKKAPSPLHLISLLICLTLFDN